MTEHRTPVRIRGVEFPQAFVSLARLAFVGLLLALGVSILRHSLGDLWSEADPALSIAIDPTQASARVAVSERLMADSKITDATVGAREALRHNPLLPQALTLLARSSEQEGDIDRATQLMKSGRPGQPKRLEIATLASRAGSAWRSRQFSTESDRFVAARTISASN